MSKTTKPKVIWRLGPYFVEVMQGRWHLCHDNIEGRIAELINPKPTDDLLEWMGKKAGDRVRSSERECERRTRMLEEAQAKHKMWSEFDAVLAAIRVEGGG